MRRRNAAILIVSGMLVAMTGVTLYPPFDSFSITPDGWFRRKSNPLEREWVWNLSPIAPPSPPIGIERRAGTGWVLVPPRPGIQTNLGSASSTPVAIQLPGLDYSRRPFLPQLLAEHLAILLVGGGLLTWALRRRTRGLGEPARVGVGENSA